MNSHKRIFLITALAALLFAAIAVGPVYKRAVTPVHASPFGPAVVTVLCDTPATIGSAPVGVVGVESTDPSVTIPIVWSSPTTPGASCAQALIGLYSQGFTRQDSSTSVYPLNTNYLQTLTILVRGEGFRDAR